MPKGGGTTSGRGGTTSGSVVVDAGAVAEGCNIRDCSVGGNSSNGTAKKKIKHLMKNLSFFEKVHQIGLSTKR